MLFYSRMPQGTTIYWMVDSDSDLYKNILFKKFCILYVVDSSQVEVSRSF